MSDYVPPEYGESAFNCPHCEAYSRQEWRYAMHAVADKEGGRSTCIDGLATAFCDNCSNFSIWLNKEMIYPNKSTAPLPSPDMPKDVLADYNEARDILEKSPKASAALLRLSIQKLCVVLSEKGENINDDIASLVSKGLPPRIQKALDTVRVIGNNAVHPGVIDLNDNPSIALSLFKLVNMVIDTMITQPKEVSGLFNSLPEESKKAIEKRDKK
jgi:hypothetical protein